MRWDTRTRTQRAKHCERLSGSDKYFNGCGVRSLLCRMRVGFSPIPPLGTAQSLSPLHQCRLTWHGGFAPQSWWCSGEARSFCSYFCVCFTFLCFLPFQTTYCLTELAVLMRKQVREKLVNHLHTDCNISVSDLETR